MITLGNTILEATMSKRSRYFESLACTTDRFGAKGMLSDVFNFDEKVRETQDIRAKIYGILSKVGFEGHESLSIRERQHIELLKLYPECREQQIAEQRTRTKWVLTVQQQLQAELEHEEAHHLNRFYDTIRMRAQKGGENEGPRASLEGTG